MIDKIPVYMPDEDAKKYLVFVKYYDPITLLIEKRVFEQKNARIILHFDDWGILQKINREDNLFNRRFEKAN